MGITIDDGTLFTLFSSDDQVIIAADASYILRKPKEDLGPYNK